MATKCFLSTAQEPGGAFIALAETADGSATAAASNANFTNDIKRMVFPQFDAPVLSYNDGTAVQGIGQGIAQGIAAANSLC